MNNMGTTIELDPKEDKLTCPVVGLYSSPVEENTMGAYCVGLDEPCVQAKIA